MRPRRIVPTPGIRANGAFRVIYNVKDDEWIEAGGDPPSGGERQYNRTGYAAVNDGNPAAPAVRTTAVVANPLLANPGTSGEAKPEEV